MYMLRQGFEGSAAGPLPSPCPEGLCLCGFCSVAPPGPRLPVAPLYTPSVSRAGWDREVADLSLALAPIRPTHSWPHLPQAPEKEDEACSKALCQRRGFFLCRAMLRSAKDRRWPFLKHRPRLFLCSAPRRRLFQGTALGPCGGAGLFSSALPSISSPPTKQCTFYLRTQGGGYFQMADEDACFSNADSHSLYFLCLNTESLCTWAF